MSDVTVRDRLQHAWNAFKGEQTTGFDYSSLGYSTGYRPDRGRLTVGNERSIIAAIYNRIAVDVAAISIQHVRMDQNGRYIETLKTGINECFTVDANLDQTGRAFVQDIVLSMFDEGCVALVPVDTTFNPRISNSFDIKSIRTGKVLEWYPQHVRLQVYNERSGRREEITVPKKMVAIIENPFYSVMNEQNSTLKRLVRKLNILDAIDEQSGSGKLDLIIQLPYVIKTPTRREQAEARRADIEKQLAGSKYGIAYADGTEKITQLNRPVENNLMNQITYLTSMLYSQLGITESVLDGTADEKTMLNYHNRTLEPVVSAIVDGAHRTFLTKTARSQQQAITFFRNPFRLVPVVDLAEIADKLTRNEILTSNEFRAIIGYRPSDDPKADELRNKNINAPPETSEPMEEQETPFKDVVLPVPKEEN